MCKQFLNKKYTPRFTSKSRYTQICSPNYVLRHCQRMEFSALIPCKQSHPPQVNCIENEL